MFKKAIDYLLSRDSYQEVIFWGVLVMIFIAALISLIFTAVEGMGFNAIFCSFLCIVFACLMGLVAKKSGQYSACYFILCVVLNMIVMPLCYFACGGFNTGVVLYCLMGVFLCTIYNNRRLRLLLMVMSLFAYEVVFAISWVHPEWVVPLPSRVVYVDQCVSYFLIALSLYAFMAYFIGVHNYERKKREALIRQLDFYSKRDPLTGLFNRRYFIKYLEDMIWPGRKGFYLLMYDIDNFKKVNDTFGHPFGDRVLLEVGRVSLTINRLNRGECTVRYGGEEFIQLIFADDMEEARARAELIRLKVSNIRFAENPEVRVTISGGLVDCNSSIFDHQNKMLSEVDRLLYIAKENGKNQIYSGS